MRIMIVVLTVLPSPVRIILNCRRQRLKQKEAVQLLVKLRQQLFSRRQTEQPLLRVTREVILTPLRIIVHVPNMLLPTDLLLPRTVLLGLAVLLCVSGVSLVSVLLCVSGVSLVSVALLEFELTLFVLLSGVCDVPVAQTVETDGLLIVGW